MIMATEKEIVEYRMVIAVQDHIICDLLNKIIQLRMDQKRMEQQSDNLTHIIFDTKNSKQMDVFNHTGNPEPKKIISKKEMALYVTIVTLAAALIYQLIK